MTENHTNRGAETCLKRINWSEGNRKETLLKLHLLNRESIVLIKDNQAEM